MRAPFPLPDARAQLRWQLAALAFFGVLLALVFARYRGPAPLGLDAPSDEFSAARARALLERLVGDGVPHPIGSAANAAVRERVRAELVALGLEPRVESALAFGGYGQLATVHNVLARIAGSGERAGAVLLACHYDSVPAGPGASDDGVGVAATLEIARILAAGPRLARDVILLVDDGEEAGLLGARAFAERDPWAQDVFAVVNVEARGTRGASILFETSAGNAWLARRFGERASYPIASSFAYRIYERMPNDTDLTVFKAHGMHGVNFGYIGAVGDYHTPGDSVARTSPRSVQHHGQNALSMVRALADEPEEAALAASGGDAVYFDLFGYALVQWPARRSWLGAAAALLALALAAALARRRGAASGRSLALGLLALPLCLGAAALAGLALERAIGPGGGQHTAWPATPAPFWIAYGAAALVAVVLVLALLQRVCGLWALWAGTWLWWALAALVLALKLPDVSFPLLVPALAAGVLGALALLLTGDERAQPRLLAALLPALVAGALWAPIAYGVSQAAGLITPLTAVLPVALVATTLAPLLAPGRGWAGLALPAAALAVLGLAAALAASLPLFTQARPSRLELTYQLDADRGSAEWLVRAGIPNTEAVLAAAAFDERVRRYPWSWRASLSAPAPALALAPPEFEVLESKPSAGGRSVRVSLRSPRGARVVGLVLERGEARVLAARVDGELAPERYLAGSSWSGGRSAFLCLSTPSSGFELELELASVQPLRAWLIDRSDGLPEGARALAEARPATAWTSGEGDVTLVSRALEL